MAIAINGSGTITGISQGGLNDNIITKNEMATGGAWAPSGTVLQVVQATNTAYTTTTSTSAVSTGILAAITPSSSSNKVLVQINFNGIYNQSSSNQLQLTLYKNGSFLTYLDWDLCSAIAVNGASSSYSYLDSPSTTSATTYTLYWNSGNGSTVGFNNFAGAVGNKTLSAITLTELAA